MNLDSIITKICTMNKNFYTFINSCLKHGHNNQNTCGNKLIAIQQYYEKKSIIKFLVVENTS